MPRKHSGISLQERTRDNQRRARARKQELIEDLKLKVNQYEQAGIQASVELQAIARRLQAENILLKRFLHDKGASDQEIASYLCGTHPQSTSATSCSQSRETEASVECCQANFDQPTHVGNNTAMDCNVAATILAGFKGHSDVQEARQELGCSDDQGLSCSVSSVALFRALDQADAS